jgi:hypothetical protein
MGTSTGGSSLFGAVAPPLAQGRAVGVVEVADELLPDRVDVEVGGEGVVHAVLQGVQC